MHLVEVAGFLRDVYPRVTGRSLCIDGSLKSRDAGKELRRDSDLGGEVAFIASQAHGGMDGELSDWRRVAVEQQLGSLHCRGKRGCLAGGGEQVNTEIRESDSADFRSGAGSRMFA
jgi:hypothetical protein